MLSSIIHPRVHLRYSICHWILLDLVLARQKVAFFKRSFDATGLLSRLASSLAFTDSQKTCLSNVSQNYDALIMKCWYLIDMFLILRQANLWPNLKPWNFNMKFFPPDMPTKSIVIFKKITNGWSRPLQRTWKYLRLGYQVKIDRVSNKHVSLRDITLSGEGGHATLRCVTSKHLFKKGKTNGQQIWQTEICLRGSWLIYLHE